MEPHIPPTCHRCPALAANRSRVVPGYGPAPARVMFVGEAPGYRGADVTGVPFTRDRSGRRLQALLIRLGLSLEADPAVERPRLRGCYLTNLVRCNPPDNRRPTRAEIGACLPYLLAELERVQPRILVPVGLLAAQVLLKHLLGRPAGRMRELHARPIRIEPGTCPGPPEVILPLRHPSRASNEDLETFTSALSALLE
ncbi:MAG TPA: uracil-DNA glycosylase [Anaerolineales bacterium]|nr:uracil-DNA glycosylase [Anaerolineales bacterium]